MSYLSTGLVALNNFIGAVSDAPKVKYSYVTNDTKATVEAADYFSDEVEMLNVGDIIAVSGDLDGTPFLADYVVSGNDGTTVTITAGELGTSASAAELDRVADVSARMVTLATSTTIAQATHEGKTCLLTGTGAAYTQTLPAATGTGAKYRFVVGAVNTSNHVVATQAADKLYGNVITNSTGDTPDLGQPWPAGGADTITLNGTTTGGQAVGDVIEVQDIATNKWQVTGVTTTSGTEATPFS